MDVYKLNKISCLVHACPLESIATFLRLLEKSWRSWTGEHGTRSP